jgi:PAS domain-containing protein
MSKQDLTIAQILRKRAEAQLKEKQKRVDLSAEELDTRKLLHELQVHQIELEMQNEELQQVYETAEKALKKYTMLYDFSPMGYFTLDSDATICDLNFTGADMLGEKRFALENKNFKFFIASGSKSIFDKFFTKVYTSSRKESCKVTLSYDDKPLCLVYIEGIVTGDEHKCLLSIVDISNLMNS